MTSLQDGEEGNPTRDLYLNHPTSSNSPGIVAEYKDLTEHAVLIDKELEEHQLLIG